MLKNISIKARREIEFFIASRYNPAKTPWALISIWENQELIGPFETEMLSKIECNEILSIKFNDLTKKEYDQEKKGVLFEEDQAKKIISFIDKINLMDIDTLLIHCVSGISRSGAVGTWACRYLSLDEKKFKKENPHILPNVYILCVLNKESDIHGDNYINFWRNPENEEKRERLFKYKRFERKRNI